MKSIIQKVLTCRWEWCLPRCRGSKGSTRTALPKWDARRVHAGCPWPRLQTGPDTSPSPRPPTPSWLRSVTAILEPQEFKMHPWTPKTCMQRSPFKCNPRTCLPWFQWGLCHPPGAGSRDRCSPRPASSNWPRNKSAHTPDHLAPSSIDPPGNSRTSSRSAPCRECLSQPGYQYDHEMHGSTRRQLHSIRHFHSQIPERPTQ